MTTGQTLSVIGGGVAAVGVVALLSLSSVSQSPTWKPKPGRVYPRWIQSVNESNEAYAKRMDDAGRTNVTGTTRWVKERP